MHQAWCSSLEFESALSYLVEGGCVKRGNGRILKLGTRSGRRVTELGLGEEEPLQVVADHPVVAGGVGHEGHEGLAADEASLLLLAGLDIGARKQ